MNRHGKIFYNCAIYLLDLTSHWLFEVHIRVDSISSGEEEIVFRLGMHSIRTWSQLLEKNQLEFEMSVISHLNKPKVIEATVVRQMYIVLSCHRETF